MTIQRDVSCLRRNTHDSSGRFLPRKTRVQLVERLRHDERSNEVWNDVLGRFFGRRFRQRLHAYIACRVDQDAGRHP